MSEATKVDSLAGFMAGLEARQVANDKIDRDAWLRARLTGITATEAKVLHTGSTRDKADVVKKKIEGDDFVGTRYTEWGNVREPALLAAANAAEYGWLIHAEGNVRHLATPDGLRRSWDSFAVVECKTSKHDVSLGSPKFESYGYLWQMLWQMYCVGTDEAYYVWEQHDDDWSRWMDRPRDRPEEWAAYGPKPIRLEVQHVLMTPEMRSELEKMIAAADRALGRLDKKVAELRAERAAAGEPEAEKSEEAAAAEHAAGLQLAAMETQAKLYRRSVNGEKALGDEKKLALAGLTELAVKRWGDEPGEHEFDPGRDDGKVYRIGYSPAGKKGGTAVDEDAAKAADPELWAEFEAAQTAFTAVQDRWKAHAASHTKTTVAAYDAKVVVTEKKGK